MDSQYHIQLLTETLGSCFSSHALDQVIAGNLGQDELCYQLGGYPHYHFENNQIERSLAYVDAEHALICELAARSKGSDLQRAAFGRLTHAVHDFYAHSNYVDLWLNGNGGLARSNAEEINGLDPALLNHPRLHTGSFLIWFDTLYYIPGVRPLLRSIYLRPNSHEAMNLDNPGQGPKFAYAMHAAKQRTCHEYWRVVAALRSCGGDGALERFCHR